MSDPYIGQIKMFSFPRAPLGWFPCDGRSLQIREYTPLYDLLGTSYGGDGTTTFAIPDLRHRAPLHQGQGGGLSARPLGSRGGVDEVALDLSQMPSHVHHFMVSQTQGDWSQPGPTYVLGSDMDGTAGDLTYFENPPAAVPAVQMSPASLSPLGGGAPHENRMPTLVINYCIAWVGFYPIP
jgi:microcystin-dependent protein